MTEQSVVVGASPIQLLYALRELHRGAQVTVIDPDLTSGGSWGTVPFAGFDHVETACHLLESHPEAYECFRRSGVPLVTMLPAPRIGFSRGVRLAYGSPALPLLQLLATPVSVGRELLRSFRRGESVRSVPGNARARLRRLWTALGDSRHRAAPIQYFRGGAGAMRGSLLATIESLGGVVCQGKVSRLLLETGGPPRVFTEGRELLPDRVVLSAAFDAEVVVDGTPLDLTARRRRHFHLLLALPPGSAAPLSYIHFPFDKVIVRVSDVTASGTARPGLPSRQLLLVQLRHPAPVPVAERAARHALVRHQILRQDHEVTHRHWTEFESVNAAPALERLAAEFPGHVVFLDSYGDLTLTVSRAVDAGQLPVGER